VSTTRFNEIREKIEKLLRLADPARGGSEAERNLAMQKAQELMEEHNVQLADLDVTREHKHQWHVTEELVKMGRKEQPWDKFIYWALTECTECKAIWDSYWENTEKAFMQKRLAILLVGTPDDIAFAKVLIPLLDRALNRGCMAWLRLKGLRWTAHLGRGYYHGLVQGFITASVDGRAAVWRKQSKEKADRYAIVVADKKDAVIAYMKEHYDNLRNKASRGGRTYSEMAAAAGHAHGATLSTSSKVGTGKAGLLS